MKQTQSRDSGQILPDVLVHGLDVVFCGSAAGSASAKAGAYYAGLGNRFWPILHESGLTPRQILPSEFRDAVQYGIGLTDLSKFQLEPIGANPRLLLEFSKNTADREVFDPYDYDIATYRQVIKLIYAGSNGLLEVIRQTECL